jgi:hypothetical protein
MMLKEDFVSTSFGGCEDAGMMCRSLEESWELKGQSSMLRKA